MASGRLQHGTHSLAAVLRRQPQPSLGVGVEKESVVQRIAVEYRYRVCCAICRTSTSGLRRGRRTRRVQTSPQNGQILPVRVSGPWGKRNRYTTFFLELRDLAPSPGGVMAPAIVLCHFLRCPALGVGSIGQGQMQHKTHAACCGCNLQSLTH